MIKRGTWAEINLGNIKDNFYAIKETLKDTTKVCCVIKADAYGHGAVKVAEMLEAENVDYLAVARFEEAIELRENGIKTPILCLGYVCEDDVREAAEKNITLTIYSLDMAKIVDRECKELDIKGKVHIKIDTGMSRLGYLPVDSSFNEIEKINKLKNIDVEGIYTHFATADESDKEETYLQLLKFRKVLDKLKEFNIDIPIKHVSNTAGTLDLKELGFNMVRVGIGLYGYYPSNDVSRDVKLKPALTLKTKITSIKDLKEGTKIGYGYTYECEKDMRIATLAIGYADGFSRAQISPQVKIKGVLCEVVGRICMDQCMVKMPSTLNVGPESDAIIIADEDGVRVEDLASRSQTISYEVLCGISKRVKRHYI